jgi:recombination protein RecR
LEYTKALADLIEEFRKFPSIGPKSAQRMAFALLKKSPEQTEKLISAIKNAKSNIRCCGQCFNLTTEYDLCEICKDTKRDLQTICVVENAKDLIALERTKEYKGVYHILGGIISPLDGIGAGDINIAPLLERVKHLILAQTLGGPTPELILALGLSTEGEATILYLRRVIDLLIKNILNQETPNTQHIKITRLAYGLPVGADLDYTDESTLAKALEARVLC